ncbi:MAG: ParA family protein, partial [Hyphomicrobium sp.]
MAVHVAIANHKGGVGKSTSTLLIAEGLAATLARRVLVIDMDPQASASTMLLSALGATRAAAAGRSTLAILDQVAHGRAVHLSQAISAR